MNDTIYNDALVVAEALEALAADERDGAAKYHMSVAAKLLRGFHAGLRRASVERNAIIKECWDALDAQIVRGELPGNGCDKSAERNGMVLASNILAEMMGWMKARYAEDLPSLSTRDGK